MEERKNYSIYPGSTVLLVLQKKNKKNSHVNVTAKVFEEFNLALAEEESRFKGHRAVQGSVETRQDLGLILRHISTVFKLQQVQIEFRICLHRNTSISVCITGLMEQ